MVGLLLLRTLDVEYACFCAIRSRPDKNEVRVTGDMPVADIIHEASLIKYSWLVRGCRFLACRSQDFYDRIVIWCEVFSVSREVDERVL
ncbi:hypothetical protein C475_22109 [Halosimplex carlsbadense 2-9-1]|uniref:Uncharacterized protein n=1 Tax=Halosimplex carlsbadense 2-9-1 TaxID=797114 RepID=M0C8X5_9EURY|nr:hypothetical protein C475_22109 [Halosimplex carlsbadense 2-9-1]